MSINKDSAINKDNMNLSRDDNNNDTTGDNDNIVNVKKLSFEYNQNTIYDKLSLQIPRYKITAIMGPSGIGKTTLLRLIGGELQSSGGNIEFNGAEITTMNQAQLMQARRKMGILFQQGALFSDLNVYENVAFLLREHTDLSEDMINDLVLMRLEAVGLRSAIDSPVSRLSGGMSRRVALARALMLDPELMLYDEPFTGQDPITRAVLMRLIKTLNDAFSMSSILVSHDVHEVQEIADYVYMITSEGIAAAGTPQQLIDSTDPKVQQFIRGQADGPVPFRTKAKNSYQQALGLDGKQC